ncbi:YT521-B-like domain-containing protein [Lactifluus volemus]|nr:YT521-B-like domain-containing protein [Lactifluus volemus]
MQHPGYASPSIMSVLRRQAPVFPYQGPSHPASSPRHTFTTSAAFPALPIYPHSPVTPPHHPTRRCLYKHLLAPRVECGVLHHILTKPYTPVGYTTPPPYAYPQTSYVPAHALSIYESQSPPLTSHYAQSYGSHPNQENRGTWWYLPQGVATAYPHEAPQHELQSQPNSDHPSPIQQNEDERPGQPRTGKLPINPSPSQKRLFRSRSGALNLEATSSSSATPIKITEGAPSGGNRSEWVMWTGNVPSDATHDELRDFFNQPLLPLSPGQSQSSTEPVQIYGGVSSIFQIPRSNCTFRLVCRIRRRTDDLMAGVGAQRGSGMHLKWIREQKAKAGRKGPVLVAPITDNEEPSSPLSTSDDDSVSAGSSQASSTSRSSRSGSFASTNSDILSYYFPQRYFILKSLSQHDLDLSVQQNLWATQRHNEEILDQAYRTSKDVFLIFSVNKSGEFYGYARMTGPIFQGEVRVPWASRFTSPAVRDENANVNKSPLDTKDSRYILLPEERRVVGDSPQSISPCRKRH